MYTVPVYDGSIKVGQLLLQSLNELPRIGDKIHFTDNHNNTFTNVPIINVVWDYRNVMVSIRNYDDLPIVHRNQQPSITLYIG